MPAARITGVLFDKDGTLFDFQATWAAVIERTIDRLAPDRETWTRMAESGGYDALRGRFRPGSPVVAGAISEIAMLWAPYRPDLGAEAIAEIIDGTALDAMASPDSLYPAVPDLSGLLRSLRAKGYPLGVATHDSERGAQLQLGIAGVLEEFDFIAGYDSGHGLKPGPGMLLAFAKATRIDPAGVVMVGDSRHDLEVARSAGAVRCLPWSRSSSVRS